MHRWENISEAFDLKNSLRPGVHIGIVDDMITTGSTLEACALLLKDHTISVFSFAFEP
jgi:predicted amidophosphoribosyltransferase